jgi:uncharacterized membrane protein (DUF106 family)
MDITIAVVIEAIIFLIPLGTLFVKLGKHIQKTKEYENAIEELKTEISQKANSEDLQKLEKLHQHDIEIFQEQTAQNNAILNSMNVEIAKISQTLELMLKGKIIT